MYPQPPDCPKTNVEERKANINNKYILFIMFVFLVIHLNSF